MAANACKPEMSTSRLEALSDGIFAIAMTMLVLSLDWLGVSEHLSSVELQKLLANQFPKFLNYFISFILLAIFWIVHHQQFCYIKKTEHKHLWINISILMFIVLIPFSTSLLSDYPNDVMAEIFFGSNMFVIGILFTLNWYYSTRSLRLIEGDLEEERIKVGLRRGLVTPAVSLLAVVVALFNQSFSLYIYILIPIILSLRPFK